MKRWRILEPEKTLSSEAFSSFHPIVTTLLANRGIADALEAEAFLNPDWETGVHDPFLFSGMNDAVARTFRAIENGERITVHGDYDADGVTGSTVVITTLREIEKKCRVPSSEYRVTSNSELGTRNSVTRIDFYIPHRDKEGYGLHRETVGILKERGTSLIITVDCGIACVAEIALAKERGIDAIILDHHQFGDELPAAHLIHPLIPNETYPFKHLAAVGVAWKFSCALIAEARRRGLDFPLGWEKWLLDLVSIATVTDMVPLVGENRVLMKYGLMVLNKTRRHGLRTLVHASGRTLGELDSESIGFSLGPRINAAGRMEHATLALNLLLSESEAEATTFAQQLEQCNRLRQKTVEGMMEVASSKQQVARDGNIVVLWDAAWSPALVGLVAGKIMERTGKPCVAVGKHGSQWIGSGRSPSFYDITQAMRRSGEGILTRVGGHPQACGFSFVDDAHASILAERLKQDAAERLNGEDLSPILSIDAELTLEDIDWRLIETVNRFEPFGIGNTRPAFLSRNLTIVDAGLVGSQGNHVRCTLRSPNGRAQRFIGFKFGSRLEEFTVGNHLDVVYDVGVNEWNGRREIQCKLVDVRVPQES